MNEPRPAHGHRHGHGGKPAGGHKPHAPAKKNGSRPHWHRGRDKKRDAAA
jgi:hypothetical protein